MSTWVLIFWSVDLSELACSFSKTACRLHVILFPLLYWKKWKVHKMQLLLLLFAAEWMNCEGNKCKLVNEFVFCLQHCTFCSIQVLLCFSDCLIFIIVVIKKDFFLFQSQYIFNQATKANWWASAVCSWSFRVSECFSLLPQCKYFREVGKV